MYWHLWLGQWRNLYSILLKSFIENNEDLIQRFTNATYRGKNGLIPIALKKLPKQYRILPDTDLETLTNVARRYKEIDAWNKDPVLKEHSFDLMQTVMEKPRFLTNEPP